NGTHTNSGSLALTVYRATMTLSGYSYANTGALYTLTGSNLSDPGQTVSQYIVRWGDSTSTTYSNTGSPTATFTHTYTKSTTANIVVDVVDGQGVSPNAASLRLTVNGPPQIQLAGDVNANVGGTYRLTMSAPYDPGFTVNQYTVHWGDGTTSIYTTIPPNGTVTHTYALVGTAPIAVDLTDSTGSYANAGTMTTKVNPPPTIAVSGSSSAYLNSPYNLTLGPANDPGQAVTQYIV